VQSYERVLSVVGPCEVDCRFAAVPSVAKTDEVGILRPQTCRVSHEFARCRRLQRTRPQILKARARINEPYQIIEERASKAKLRDRRPQEGSHFLREGLDTPNHHLTQNIEHGSSPTPLGEA